MKGPNDLDCRFFDKPNDLWDSRAERLKRQNNIVSNRNPKKFGNIFSEKIKGKRKTKSAEKQNFRCIYYKEKEFSSFKNNSAL